MQPSVSVLICSHNPREDYLARTLSALEAQTLPKAEWELLLIDNASAPKLADRFDLSWHPHARHVREEELGLTQARLRGIKESSGEALIFVDDDNLLTATYLQSAVRLLRSYSYLGLVGAGSIEPEFEVPPQRDFEHWLPLLTIRDVQIPRWSNNPSDFDSSPWGAGLCMSRQVSEAYTSLVNDLNVTDVIGRRGKELFSGDDDLFRWGSVRIGKGFGVFPELRITHLIGANRVRDNHLVELIRGHTYSDGVLQYVLSGRAPRTIDTVECVRLGLHGLKNGRLAFRCRLALMRGEQQAARYIAANGLRPIIDELMT